MKRYIVIFGVLVLLGCKNARQYELENIRKSIENFNINENIEKITEYFDNKNIQYSLLRSDDIENIEVTPFIDNDDRILFCVYYIEKSKDFIKTIKETYYSVYIIFNENDELKKIVFDESYLAL